VTIERKPNKTVKRADLKSALIVGAHLGFVFAPLGLAAFIGPSIWWLLLWVWFGLSMQALLNLMHEVTHLHVFKSRRANELFGRWLLGPMMFADFDRYREVHWAHHRNVGLDDDPKYSYRIDIRGIHFLQFCLRSLVLVEAVRKLRYVHGDARPQVEGGQDRAWLVRTAVFQSAVLGTLFTLAVLGRGDALSALFAAVLAYGFVYIYGVLSLTVMAANLRAICEHQLFHTQLESSGLAALRNLHSTALSWMIFGAYGFDDHATHHLNPSLPYYLLEPETRRLTAENSLKSVGYFEILFSMIAARNESMSARPARSALMF
jgi:fatty acid desaturase